MPARRRRQVLALLLTAVLGGTAVSVPAGAQTTSLPDPSQIPQLTPSTTTAEQEPPAPATTTAATAPTPPATTTAATPSAARAQTLPATGLDGRILGGLGAGLLLCGIGLRLRTARERF